MKNDFKYNVEDEVIISPDISKDIKLPTKAVVVERLNYGRNEYLYKINTRELKGIIVGESKLKLRYFPKIEIGDKFIFLKECPPLIKKGDIFTIKTIRKKLYNAEKPIWQVSKPAIFERIPTERLFKVKELEGTEFAESEFIQFIPFKLNFNSDSKIQNR